MVLSNKKLQKIMTQPINLIFRHFTSKSRVLIWLYEQNDIRLEGVILGFDEYMNMVLDDAYEVSKKKKRKKIGRLLLKGENITLIMSTQGGGGGGSSTGSSARQMEGQENGET